MFLKHAPSNSLVIRNFHCCSERHRVTETLNHVGKLTFELRHAPSKNADGNGDCSGHGRNSRLRSRVKLKPLSPTTGGSAVSTLASENNSWKYRKVYGNGSSAGGTGVATTQQQCPTHTSSNNGGAAAEFRLPPQEKHGQEAQESITPVGPRRTNFAWSSSICVIS